MMPSAAPVAETERGRGDVPFAEPAAKIPWASLSLLAFLAQKSLFESRLGLLLLVAAVATGVGFQVANTANLEGYQAALLDEGIAAGSGDIRVRPRHGQTLENVARLTADLARYPGVRAVLPVVMVPGAIAARGRGSFTGSLVVGVDGEGEFRPFRLASGRPLARGDDAGILVGESLADRLGLRPGDAVPMRALLAAGPALLDEERYGRYTLTVRGLAGGAWGADESVFVDRTFLAREIGAPDEATLIVVYLGDHFAARPLARRMESDLPAVTARAWIDDSPFLASSFHAYQAVSTLSQTMVVVAVTIPVLALLYINVLQRRREIGLLCALGIPRREVFVVFLLQALAVGLIGAVVGCALGYVVIRYFQAHPIFAWKGFVIRPVLAWTCFVKPSLVVVGATVLAGVYPAFRAATADPAPVFRGLGE
ncbi:MAG: ABC transporter permease [Myxococcales bacterium]|nr:ABC transporter permease [Myxococcales bacterium]